MRWFLVVVFGFLGACAGVEQNMSAKMYPGAERGQDELAIVLVSNGPAMIGGINSRRYDRVHGVNPVQDYRLLPGKHVVQLIVYEDAVFDKADFSVGRAQSLQQVTLVAGHTYLPKAEMSDGRLNLWLEDMGRLSRNHD
ncbi:hypothetical protein WKI13_00205 [Teredinibacter turnerae]|uniref:hypothetical protein n=1 Tax=Teredinibacter turnerae TaxID=2426 RepID=UPI00037C8865|nr:hypothetical protein [Teredinibacter turnerae]